MSMILWCASGEDSHVSERACFWEGFLWERMREVLMTAR